MRKTCDKSLPRLINILYGQRKEFHPPSRLQTLNRGKRLADKEEDARCPGVHRFDRTLVLAGYLWPFEPMLNTVLLIGGRKSVAESLIDGIAETQDMLDFCGEHGITSDIEAIKIQDINAAYECMLRSDVYRFLSDMASLKA